MKFLIALTCGITIAALILWRCIDTALGESPADDIRYGH